MSESTVNPKFYEDYRGTISKEAWNDAWEKVTPSVVITASGYNVTSEDGYIECSGTFTVTLPEASGNTNKIIYIKNIYNGTITASGTGADLIDEEVTQILDEKGDEMPVISNGTCWRIL